MLISFHNFIFNQQRLKQSVKPTEEWGPALNINRKEAGYQPLPNQDDDMPDEFGNPDKIDNSAEFGNRTPPPEYSNIAFEADKDVTRVTMESKGVDTTELKEFTNSQKQ